MSKGTATEQELITAAWELVPVLAERAQTCEEQRQLPAETIADFEQAGFYRISQPKEYGGYQMSPEVIFKVAMILARGCPSSAWCMALISVHNWEPGLMDARAALDLWGEDQDVRYSSSYAPMGKLAVVEGGYRLSGHWEWSSGSGHCSWVMVGALLPRPDDADPAAPREQIALLVPGQDYTIIDTWHVSGLKGTGSNDIVVEDAFVPEHRIHRVNAPSQRAFGGGVYDLPFANIFALCLCSVTQGIAEGALEAYGEYLARRVHKFDGKPMSNDPFQQRKLSEASIEVRANRDRFHGVFRRLEEALQVEQTVPLHTQLSEIWETQFVAHRNADIVTSLMRSSGGGAHRLSHPMQRYFRDINAAVAHAYLGIDRGSLQFADAWFRQQAQAEP